MLEFLVQRTVNAIYALLSMVSDQGEKALEARGQQAQLPILSLGNSGGFLELLRLVPRTGKAGEMMRLDFLVYGSQA